MSLIMLIIFILFGGIFGMTSSSSTVEPVAVAPWPAYSISSAAHPAHDDLVQILDVRSEPDAEDASSTNVSVQFEILSDDPLAMVEITITCLDDADAVIETARPQYRDLDAGGIVTGNDVILTTSTCSTINAQVTDVEP